MYCWSLQELRDYASERRSFAAPFSGIRPMAVSTSPSGPWPLPLCNQFVAGSTER